MMKQFAGFLLIVLVFSQVAFCQNESTDNNQKYLFEYTHFISQGEYSNGLKDGRWIDVSDSGVIYVDGNYSHGVPIDKWKINYPGGVLRKTILYDSLGNIIKWTRYDSGIKKLIEIFPDSIISISAMRRISSSEENYFDLEATGYQSDFAYNATVAQARQENPGAGFFRIAASNIENIIDTLMCSDFQGKCFLFYESGNVSKQYTFKKGAITDIRKLYYKNGKVNIEDVYIDNKLKRTIKYDETGKVIKIKEN